MYYISVLVGYCFAGGVGEIIHIIYGTAGTNRHRSLDIEKLKRIADDEGKFLDHPVISTLSFNLFTIIAGVKQKIQLAGLLR